jgi:hypothetical protein
LLAGNSQRIESANNEPATARLPAGALAWVTQELIDHTILVWQRYYDRPMTAEEALAIVQTAGELMDALSQKPKT